MLVYAGMAVITVMIISVITRTALQLSLHAPSDLRAACLKHFTASHDPSLESGYTSLVQFEETKRSLMGARLGSSAVEHRNNPISHSELLASLCPLSEISGFPQRCSDSSYHLFYTTSCGAWLQAPLFALDLIAVSAGWVCGCLPGLLSGRDLGCAGGGGCCSPLAILIAAKPEWDPAVQATKSVQEELSASFWHVSGGYPRVLPPRWVPRALLVHPAKGFVRPVNQS